MAGYERQSSAEIIPGATVRAAPINAEYNQLDAAFEALTGHKHDGSTGEGGYVPLIADVDALNKVVVDTANNKVTFYTEVAGVATAQIEVVDGKVVPVTDNDVDLGSATAYFKDAYIKGNLQVAAISATGSITPSADGTYDLGSASLEWRNLYIDGTATIDTLQVDENATVTGNLSVNGNTTVGNANTDTVAINAKITTSLVPNIDNAVDLGASGNEWRNLYIDGTANIDSLVADTADINGGNIDGVAIGASTASTAKFTQADVDNIRIDTNTISSTDTNGNIHLTPNGTGKVVTSKADIDGGSIDGVTIGTSSAVTELRVDNIKVDGNTISSTNTNGDINLTPDGTGKVVTSRADINGGTIDGTAIGGSTPAAGAFTTLSANAGITGDLTGDVTGNISATSGNSTLYTLDITNSLDMNAKVISAVGAPTLDADAATKKYVDDSITALIDGAPATLNTLNELAAALGDDASNVYTAIGERVAKSGDTMTGNLSMNTTNRIISVADPINAQDVATKNYIDTTYVDYSSAGDAAYDAQKLAVNPEDSLFTLSDGTTTGYSALHYAAKVAQTYDAFDDRYLGDKVAEPALDNDGNPLQTGALFFDSANNVMKVYNGVSWQAASSSIEGIKGDFEYTCTANQTVFTGTDNNGNALVIDVANLVNVYLNGVRLIASTDYIVSPATNTVTLITGAAAGDILELEVFGNFAGQSGAEVSITGGSVANVTLNNANVASGDLSFADNQKATFGAGSDLEIWSNGDTSYIRDSSSTGNLEIRATDLYIKSGDNTKVSAFFDSDGESKLYYNGASKLATTTAGVDVSGSVNVTSAGTTTPTSVKISASNAVGQSELNLHRVADNDGYTDFKLRNNGSLAFLYDTNAYDDRRAMSIHSGGDVYFYHLDGSTYKVQWDANVSTMKFVSGAGLEFNGYTFKEEGGYLYVYSGSTKIMRLDSAGNLDVVGNINSNATI